MKSNILSLSSQYHMYKHYHQNTTNKRIHFVFIPVLITSFFALLMAVPLPAPLADLGRVTALLFIAYYIILEPVVGLLFAPFMAAMYLVAQYCVSGVGARNGAPLVFAVHLLAWVAQLVGHYAFEGRQPAVVDGLVQSVLAAPIVVWLEMGFSLGLAPEFKKRLLRSRAVSKARKAVNKVVD